MPKGNGYRSKSSGWYYPGWGWGDSSGPRNSPDWHNPQPVAQTVQPVRPVENPPRMTREGEIVQYTHANGLQYEGVVLPRPWPFEDFDKIVLEVRNHDGSYGMTVHAAYSTADKPLTWKFKG